MNELDFNLTEEMRAEHAALCVRQGPADYFIAGAAFGFALAIITLATRH